MLNEQEIETLNQLERVGLKWKVSAGQLLEFVYKCRQQQTTEGLSDMVAFSFNAHQYTPSYGGGNFEQLPPGQYDLVIVDIVPVNTKDAAGNVKGGYLALTLTPINGALAGQKHTDRINLHHSNPKTVEIANEQMAAYCHVVGQYQISDTAQLCNIPFKAEIGWQKGNEPSAEKPNGGYTEVKAIYDANGNPPGKAGSGAPAAAAPAPAAAPPAQVAPVAAPPAAWGGAPAQAQPAAQAPAQPAAPAQAPAQAQPAAWGGAAAPAAAGPAPWGAPAA